MSAKSIRFGDLDLFKVTGVSKHTLKIVLSDSFPVQFKHCMVATYIKKLMNTMHFV